MFHILKDSREQFLLPWAAWQMGGRGAGGRGGRQTLAGWDCLCGGESPALDWGTKWDIPRSPLCSPGRGLKKGAL